MPPKYEPPPLAHFKQRNDYHPLIGDFIVWSGWITTWHGIIVGYDRETDDLICVFSGVPYLLMTLNPNDYDKETRRLKLTNIRNAGNGKFAILQKADNQQPVWFI